MKINVKAESKIQTALDTAQQNCTANMATCKYVSSLAWEAERALDELELPKKYRAGVQYKHTEAGPANAYKYKMPTTTITLERGSAGWFLVGVSRNEVYPGEKEYSRLKFTADQKRVLIERFEQEMCIV